MNRLARLLPWAAAPPPLLLNSLPKSGTHLLSKALDLLPGLQRAPLHLGQTSAHRLVPTPDSDRSGRPGLPPSSPLLVPIGIDWPHPIPLTTLRTALRRIAAGQYATAHLPFSPALAVLLPELGMKSLLMLRDPRDIVVSHARHVARTAKHFLSPTYTPLTPAERITLSIRGLSPPAAAPHDPRLLDIGARCRSVQGWLDQPFNYTTTFEKLVGPQGGGSQTAQRQELTAVAHHLGFSLPEERLAHVARQLFGGTNTFDRGAIGAWRREFDANHRALFKEIAGQLLIEWGYEQDLDW